MDYRDLGDERFDAIASIGMVEHVGEAQIDEYARQIAQVLEPGGRVLNHGIVAVPPQEGGAHIGGEFSEPLRVSRRRAAQPVAHDARLRAGGLRGAQRREPAHRLRRDAAPLDDPPRASASTRPSDWPGSERLRVWRLYLRAARNSFETGQNAVYQLLCSRPLTEGPSSTPTGARHEPARRRVPPERVPA